MNYQIYLPNISRLLLIICAVLISFPTIIQASKADEASTERAPVADFDGDGKSDIAVFRPSDRYWHINKSSGGFLSFQWGLANDNPVPGDYDGDGRAEAVVHRKPLPSITSDWYVLRIQDFALSAKRLPTSFIGEYVIPIPADYDGDGKTDFAYYGVSDVAGDPGEYFILLSLTNTITRFKWGNPMLGDRPVPADYDGDGRADYAVYRGGTWFILQTANVALRVEYFGLPTDLIVPGDYDGDGKADIAVWRPSNGLWCLLLSRDNSVKYVRFGLPDDKPTPADYDGDGRTDIAVFRPSEGIWYLQQSSGGFRAERFGLPTDIPIQNVFVR